jgi:putative multiple sugar transport system substrate-binding protein
VLVIAAIDGATLTDVLQKAHDAGILVMAYDRLLVNTGQCGLLLHLRQLPGRRAAGQPDRRCPGSGKCAAGPVQYRTLRRLAGRHQRLLLLRRRHVDLAALYRQRQAGSCSSGQTGMDKVSTLRWSGETAQARMDNLLSAYYGDKRLDAVLSPYDGISIGILSSLKGVGYGSAEQPMPVVTGQDAEIPSVKSILAGEQYGTIFKDTRELAKVTAEMVERGVERRRSADQQHHDLHQRCQVRAFLSCWFPTAWTPPTGVNC